MAGGVSSTISSFPRFTTTGLRLNLDAGNVSSYPGSGSTWTDTIGGKTFTLVNSPVFSSTNGGVISFVPASNQYAYSSSLPLLNTWTIEVWHYYDGTNDGSLPCIVTNKFTGQPINFSLGSNTTGPTSLQSGWWNSGWRSTSPSTLTAGNWYHIVATYNGTNVKLYINKTLVQDAAVSGTIATSTDGIYLMSRWDFVSENWGGKLAVVRIYDNALSQSDINNNYNVHKSRFGLS